MKKNKIIIALLLVIGLTGFSQEDEKKEEKEEKEEIEEQEEKVSNIQEFTPSKLLNQGQWDIKLFNGLYTQRKQTGENNSNSSIVPRENFNTTTLEVFTGISKNNRVNIGAVIEYRSNTRGGRSALAVFEFADNNLSRNGFSNISPSIRIQPFKSISNFSYQGTLHIPLIGKGDDSTSAVFLDQSTWVFQNRYFYDYTLPSGDWQLFTELNTEYSFGDEDSFSHQTLLFVPSIFMSYFPSSTTTILGFVQHSQRVGGNFQQNGSSLGFGGKIQLNDTLNLEALYSKIVRGHNFQGLGNSFSVGLRALL